MRRWGVVLLLLASDALAFERILPAKGTAAPTLDDAQSSLLIFRSDASPCDGDAGCPSSDEVTIVHRPRFKIGPAGARFVLLTATPAAPLVASAPEALLDELDAITAPMVAYHDTTLPDESLPGGQCTPASSPSATTSPPPTASGGGSSSSGGATSGGGTSSGGTAAGCDSGPSKPPPVYNPPTQKLSQEPSPEGGPLDLGTGSPLPFVTVLPASTPADVQSWLDANGYAWSSADLDALAPYLAMGWTLVAARLSSATDFSDRTLDGFSLTYRASEVRLPAAIARGMSPNNVSMTAYIASDTRYEIGAADAVTWARASGEIVGASYLTRNEWTLALDGLPASDPIAIRKPPTDAIKTITVNRTFHVGASRCMRNSGGCRVADGQPFAPPAWFLLMPLLALAGRSLRRESARPARPDGAREPSSELT